MSTPINARTLTSRREALALLGSAAVVSASGCCELRGLPKPEIDPRRAGFADRGVSAFLAPRRVNTVRVPTRHCIDVHAHFFNASDVTVKGYLEGPVAFSMSEPLRTVVKLLAPIADAMAEFAPTASKEFSDLNSLAALTITDADRRQLVMEERDRDRIAISKKFDELTRSRAGRPFRTAYEEIMQASAGAAAERRPRIRSLNEESVLKAMQEAEKPIDLRTSAEFAATDRSPYAEGILAFVGYLMSKRQQNLLTYQAAFTEEEHTIGVRRALGSLVDFDRWLKCAPRSAHEDQMKLHLKLSQVTDGYMLPLISYNPWTDVVEPGRGLALVEEAVKAGCVGVKIYPQNGFRPWGNPTPSDVGGPDGEKITEALKNLWLKCEELGVPVMAHAGESMGSDDLHNRLGGPDEWRQLLDAPYWTGEKAPRVSLGHFGGDEAKNEWTLEFAKLMGTARGRLIYGDLGYWSDLQCGIVGAQKCHGAQERLRGVLDLKVGDGETVADRVMFGSDWHMLSKEKNWPLYAQELVESVRAVSPDNVEKIFGENAKNCFGPRLRLS